MMANKDNRNKKVVLGKKLDTYLDLVQTLFLQIDDYYLLNQDELSYMTKNPEIRCMYLRIKYGKDQVAYTYQSVLDEENERDVEMCFHGLQHLFFE